MSEFDRLKLTWIDYRLAIAKSKATKKTFDKTMRPHKLLWKLKGGAMARGAIDHLLERMIWVVLFLVAFWTFTGGFDRDDTDSLERRSNMELLTDYGTGCQYLKRGDALTPRLNSSGIQVCAATLTSKGE